MCSRSCVCNSNKGNQRLNQTFNAERQLLSLAPQNFPASCQGLNWIHCNGCVYGHCALKIRDSVSEVETIPGALRKMMALIEMTRGAISVNPRTGQRARLSAGTGQRQKDGRRGIRATVLPATIKPRVLKAKPSQAPLMTFPRAAPQTPLVFKINILN